MAKKLLSLFLCLFLFLTVTAGCKQEGTTAGTTTGTTTGSATTTAGLVSKTGYPVVTQDITFKGVMPDNARKPYNENIVAEWMKEITGISIDMTTIASDVYQEKLGVMLAGGDYPDFFYMADMTLSNQQLYGRDSGILVDLKPLIDDGWAENFKKFSDGNADIYRIATVDGALYAMPFLMNGLNEPLFMINKAWMDAVGKGMPKTLDELTDLLRAFKTEDPNGNNEADEIPISSAGNVYWYNPIITCFGLTTTGWQEDDNGKVFHGATTQNYKDYLTWTAKIYAEGLLDARVPTGAINDEQIVADMKVGKVGMIYTAHTDWLDEAVADQMTGFMPFAYGSNATGVWPQSITLVPGTFCITDKCEYPEAMLRWVDYWYSEEGQIMMWNGLEGKTFEIAADNSIKFINIPEGMTEDQYRNTWSIQGHHYYPGFYSYFTNQHTILPRKLAYINGRAALVPISKKAISEYSLTSEESEAISVMSTDIDNYIVNSEAKFMAGELKVEKDWQTFQDTLVAMKLETVQATIQGAVDRFYGK